LQLAVGAVTLQRNALIPLSLTLSVAIPGIKFRGSVTRNESTQVTGIGLNLRRADNLIVVSILINAMMIGLAVGVLAMVLQVTTARREFGLSPLSISIWLASTEECAAWRATRWSVQRLCHFYLGGIDCGSLRCSCRLALAAASASFVRILAVRNRRPRQFIPMGKVKKLAALQTVDHRFDPRQMSAKCPTLEFGKTRDDHARGESFMRSQAPSMSVRRIAAVLFFLASHEAQR
jgi:hypothetical protein